MRSLRFALTLLLILLALSACQSAPEFAIYLLSQPLTGAQAQKLSLAELPLQKTPLLTVADLLGYNRQTHEMELTPAAFARLRQIQVPVSGLPFVVCVGSQRIYQGAVWTLLSSLSYDGIIILQPFYTASTLVRIEPGYPSAEFFTGKDPRADARIFQALAAAGKLR